MGKTKRNASRWMETRFKYGDTQYPEENETHYFNGRYQNAIRNGNRNYYALFIDPESIKVRCWKECGNWAKANAHRAARHNAKILVKKLTNEILIEQMMDLEDELKGWMSSYNEDYHEEYDFSYSDEGQDYAEKRRQEELDDLSYEYDRWFYEPHWNEDWDY